jgi:ankyrin repeat protein
LGDNIVRNEVWDIPLAIYSAENWVDHAQFGAVSSRISGAMQHFFNEYKPHWGAWLRLYDLDSMHRSSSDTCTTTGHPVPLYYAALCGFYDLAGRLVVKNPWHVDVKGGRKRTPLGAALHKKNLHVADLLHRHGADVNQQDSVQWTLLHAAAYEGNIDAVQWLLDHGAILNTKSFLGREERLTALHCAAFHGHLPVCRMLVERNAYVNARNELGLTALHVATTSTNYRDQLDVMRFLITKGANVNAQDKDGCTPLHHSSFWAKAGYESCTGTIRGSHLLLEHGAKINAKNKRWQTPLRLALDTRRYEMAEFLSGMGAR